MLLLLVLQWCPLNLLPVMGFEHCTGCCEHINQTRLPRRTPLPPMLLFSENPTRTANYKKRTMAPGLGVGWDKANRCATLQCTGEPTRAALHHQLCMAFPELPPSHLPGLLDPSFTESLGSTLAWFWAIAIVSFILALSLGMYIIVFT